MGKADAQFLVNFGAEGVTSLSMVLHEVVGLLSKLWLDSLERGVGVCADVEDFSSTGVVETDFLLELPLKVVEQSVVKLVVLGQLSLDLGAVVGRQEVLVVVQLVGVGLVFEGVDSRLVQDDSLFQEEEASEHESVACGVEDVSLLGQISELSAGVHDEHDDFLLVDVALSGLGNYSFLVSLSLACIISVNVLHVELDVERIDELDFLLGLAVPVFLEQLGDLVFGVSEHHGPRKVKICKR